MTKSKILSIICVLLCAAAGWFHGQFAIQRMPYAYSGFAQILGGFIGGFFGIIVVTAFRTYLYKFACTLCIAVALVVSQAIGKVTHPAPASFVSIAFVALVIGFVFVLEQRFAALGSTFGADKK